MVRTWMALLILLCPALAHGATIEIKWVDKADNETSFKVERSLTGNTADFAVIASPGANITTYVDSGLAENMTYYYRVAACNSAGCSPYTAVVSAKTLVSIPATPGDPTAKPLP